MDQRQKYFSHTETELKQNISPLKKVVESSTFNLLIVTLIIIGAIMVGLSTYPSLTDRWGTLINFIDWLIIVCFTVEIFMRMMAELPSAWKYFTDPWNIFDFVIVTLCILPLDNDAVVAVRLVRLLRVMRLFRIFPRLRLLIRGIVHSISSVGYVGALLLLQFYIFAVIGVSLFSSYDSEHFGDLGKAFLTLFQILTLENWPDLLAPIKNAKPIAGILFFVIFIVTGTMVVMNLFVGVIVGGMSEAIEESKKENDLKQVQGKSLVNISEEISDIEQELALLSGRLKLLNNRIINKEPSSENNHQLS